MFGWNAARFLTFSALLASLGACATSSNAFERNARHNAAKRAAEAADDRTVCPVTVRNVTGQQIDAGYRLNGVASTLGLIPDGRSLSFGVLCDAGAIEAFATSAAVGFFGGAQEFMTVAALDRTRETRVDFTVVDRIR